MARKPRFAPPGYWHHITQRGNYRQQTFFSPQDHTHFLSLLGHAAELHAVDVLAYCLMPNHFHLIARAHTEGGISRFVHSFSFRYSQYLHSRLTRIGQLWQGRFYSCLLDDDHLFSALKYVELNPVHSGIVPYASDFPWSSAAAHTASIPSSQIPRWLDQHSFAQLRTPSEWCATLSEPQSSSDRALIKQATASCLPLASDPFLHRLERQFDRPLHRRPVGHPTTR